MYLIKLL